MKETAHFSLDDVVSDADDRARVGLIMDLAPNDDLYLVLWRGEEARTWIDGYRLLLVDDSTGRWPRSPQGRGG
ncbi:MAG: hypothetical protein F4090_07015 [Nitrospira sp. SB0672_bin_25]|nr:hypothetical protein [Nitrospira sp. SB0666_bin_27]MYF25502.1 hypothetical protein [Nitrospira sp. SB0678_bin_10]MYJ54634.1 hypothetical protein [Nitrospira sp. SB0672_bin_25]